MRTFPATSGHGRPLTALLALLALSAAVTACGSSSSDDKAATAEPSTTAASTNEKTKEAQGKPIVVANVSELTGVPGFDTSPMVKGEQAAAAYINDHGGIDGRPVKVISCDSKFNPGGSLACAQKVMAQNPIAITGIDDYSGSSGADALYKGRKTITMNSPSQPTLIKSTNAFPVANGGAGEFLGLGYYLGSVKKLKSFAQLQQDTPVGHAFAEQLEGALKRAGASKVTTVFFPNTITDFSAPVAKLTSARPDGYFALVNGPQIPIVWGQIQRSGARADQIYIESAGIAPGTLEKAGAVAKGVHVINEFKNPDDTSDPEVAIYREAMKKYGYGDLGRALLAEWGFANIMFLRTVAKATGGRKATAASVQKYLTTTIGPGATGSIPAFLGSPMTAAPEEFPGIHRGGVVILQWNGTKFETASSGFITAPELR